MNKLRIASFVGALLLSCNVFAQNSEPEMADVLRESGKIYTVVAVLGIILTGLFVYLFLTERKLSKLEKKITSK
jgi:CcmD family protein